MLNIVIPMAGRGSRFAEAGYTTPKPLIKIHNKTLIQCVTENLTPSYEHRFIYICLEEHIDAYDLEAYLEEISPDCIIVPVDHVTEGAACTVLLAESYIDNDNMLMIANSDQYVVVNIDDYINSIKENDGLIMTMRASDKKWSYIEYNDKHQVTLVREKEVISNMATVGIYNYKKGSDFVKYAKQMILDDLRVNNEFYVAPAYNQMIEDGKQIGYYCIGSEADGMYGLGIPQDLDIFRKLQISERF